MPRLELRELTDPPGVWVEPAAAVGTGVLVLGGSSGAVEVDRAALLARHGAAAASIRWFGGPGQPPGICEVPLETFGPVLGDLRKASDRVAVVGVSKGAEAALLLAAHDTRVDAVIALAPTHVVWANLGAGSDGQDTPPRSSWTVGGAALPFVPYDERWTWDGEGDPAFRGLYEQSLRAEPGRVAAATIPVERIAGAVVLVAGTDDQVWPSEEAARAIEARRRVHGLDTMVITHPLAGHRTTLPGEQASPRGAVMARGGTPEADAELGALVWPVVVQVLRLYRAAGGDSVPADSARRWR